MNAMMLEKHPPQVSASIALLLVLIVSGCATTSTLSTYSGPSRPRSEVGTLRLGGGFSQNLTYCKTALVSLDGKYLAELPWRSRINTVEVLPGEHQMVFDCYFDIGVNPVAGPGTITMQTSRLKLDNSLQEVRIVILPGHRYQALYQFNGALGWSMTPPPLKSFDVTDLTANTVLFQTNILRAANTQ